MGSSAAVTAIATLSLALLLGGGADKPAPTAERALPWLRNFSAAAVADAPSRAAEAWLRDHPIPQGEGCTTTSDAGLALTAELAPAPGLETVIASYTGGVAVLDARGRRLASSPALTCRGSADAIEAVATGEVLAGEPAIVLAATSGGRAERTIWLFVLAARGEALAPIFAVPVEEHRGDLVQTGEVVKLPGGELGYRAPGGGITLWAYDRAAGRFVLRAVIRPSPEPEPAPGTAA